MIKTLKRNLTKKTALGLQLLALPAIIEYPNAYKLGKRSVRFGEDF